MGDPLLTPYWFFVDLARALGLKRELILQLRVCAWGEPHRADLTTMFWSKMAILSPALAARINFAVKASNEIACLFLGCRHHSRVSPIVGRRETKWRLHIFRNAASVPRAAKEEKYPTVVAVRLPMRGELLKGSMLRAYPVQHLMKLT